MFPPCISITQAGTPAKAHAPLLRTRTMRRASSVLHTRDITRAHAAICNARNILRARLPLVYQFRLQLPGVTHFLKARSAHYHAVIGSKRTFGIFGNSFPSANVRTALHGKYAALPAYSIMSMRFVFALAATAAPRPNLVDNQRRKRFMLCHDASPFQRGRKRETPICAPSIPYRKRSSANRKAYRMHFSALANAPCSPSLRRLFTALSPVYSWALKITLRGCSAASFASASSVSYTMTPDWQ